ncbi:MAG TPA: lipopolysaccharide biosynthesis protein, partial [Caulobacteraceae bacterium]|nr:lipopolysaccharide biosynthesis protein [Caulobacteraceae bacterium]
QESQAARAIALGGENSIRVVQRAFAPTKGASLRKAVIAAAFLFAAFTALCAGLLRILLRRGYVTADATARSLELPVLATAPVKRSMA